MKTRPRYEVLERRQAWRIVGRTYYREAVVRRADGAIRLFLIPDGKLGEA